MTEKKTFKVGGPLDYGLNYEHDFHEWRLYGVQTVFEDGVNAFPTDEWDMEVTFTKKAKPLEVGSVVEDLAGNTGRVVFVRSDKAWVHYYLNDSGVAVDFDCVEWLTEISNVS